MAGKEHGQPTIASISAKGACSARPAARPAPAHSTARQRAGSSGLCPSPALGREEAGPTGAASNPAVRTRPRRDGPAVASVDLVILRHHGWCDPKDLRRCDVISLGTQQPTSTHAVITSTHEPCASTPAVGRRRRLRDTKQLTPQHRRVHSRDPDVEAFVEGDDAAVVPPPRKLQPLHTRSTGEATVCGGRDSFLVTEEDGPPWHAHPFVCS